MGVLFCVLVGMANQLFGFFLKIETGHNWRYEQLADTVTFSRVPASKWARRQVKRRSRISLGAHGSAA